MLSKVGAGMMIDVQQEHIIAVDSLIMIVHPSNPMNSIAIRDIARIYKGEVTNWRQLGGPDLAITAYNRPEDSGSRAVFDTRVLNNATPRTDMKLLDSSKDMSMAVMNDPTAIGFVSYAFVSKSKPLNLISECGIVSKPITFLAKTEEYPLAHRLYIYNRKDNFPALAGKVLDYTQSEDAYGVIEKSGSISLGIERVGHNVLHGRMDITTGNTTEHGHDGKAAMDMGDKPAMDMGTMTMDMDDKPAMGMAMDDTPAMDMGHADDESMESNSDMAMDSGMSMQMEGMEVPRTGNPIEDDLMDEVMGEMFQWDNLSTVFRFATGSETLERKSLLDLILLVEYLANEPDGAIIAFAGFTDDDGAFSANLKLSTRRAEKVRQEIQALGGDRLSHITFQTRAYGPLTPAVCNTTIEEKRINRRVEVWIQNPHKG